jgi:dolichol-phosphate mannosyltransferase
MHLSVVVPTYREAENLRLLVPAVARAIADTGRSGEIVVVDDDSPDDTPAVCADLARQYPLRLLVRKHERGLATAVLHGLRQSAGEVLVVMDADLSHPPEKVPELLAALEAGAEFVIGSRYVPGAHTDEDWGWFRRLNSRVATALARGFTSARDPMAGFFALRRSTFLAARDLDPIGYKIALELIVKCGCRTVVEVPIAFRNRVKGESKLNLREQINYLRHLRRLYAYKWRHAPRPRSA